MMSTTEEILQPIVLNTNKYEGKGRGQIQIIFGPMFSGKTTELMRRMKRYELANKKCLVVKYAKDDRYSSDAISTHDRQVYAAVAATELKGLLQKARNYEVIGIDEGQFFHDVVSFSDTLAEIGKTVIVAALDGTFQKKGFGDILNLVPLAENVIKLTAVCMKCFSDASYTKRKGMETEVHVEVIGGADKYLAVCRSCYFSPKKVVQEQDEKENTPVLSDVTSQTKSLANRKLFLTPQRLNLS